MTSVVIVDDHRLIREGLRRSLEDAGIEVVAEAADGASGLHEVARQRPDVVLMDVSMPVLDGIAATRRIASRHPDVAVLVLTMHDDAELARRAREAGAAGYLLKDASSSEVVAAVRGAASGKLLPLQPLGSAGTADGGGDGGRSTTIVELSSREVQILQLLADGRSPAEVAETLTIAPKTVRNHLWNAYDKLGVNSRSQALVAALQAGLIELH